jgi:hypothetical protein
MYDVSCGKGRRGCCIVVPATDSTPGGLLVAIYRPSVGGSPDWEMVFIPNSAVTGEHSQAVR